MRRSVPEFISHLPQLFYSYCFCVLPWLRLSQFLSSLLNYTNCKVINEQMANKRKGSYELLLIYVTSNSSPSHVYNENPKKNWFHLTSREKKSGWRVTLGIIRKEYTGKSNIKYVLFTMFVGKCKIFESFIRFSFAGFAWQFRLWRFHKYWKGELSKEP